MRAFLTSPGADAPGRRFAQRSAATARFGPTSFRPVRLYSNCCSVVKITERERSCFTLSTLGRIPLPRVGAEAGHDEIDPQS